MSASGNWDRTTEEVKRVLARRAQDRSLITYSELAGKIRTERFIPNSNRLSSILTAISLAEEKAGRGLLSAVVIQKVKRGIGIPGVGFFKLPRVSRCDQSSWRRCWERERDRVYRYWGSRRSAASR